MRFVKTMCASIVMMLCVLGSSNQVWASDLPVIFLPFEAGSDWYVVQGQFGSFTHLRGSNLQYAFDFTKGPNSSSQTFGQPLYSPVNGEVVEVRNGVRDWQNNGSANAANHYGWGNTVVIKADDDGTDIFVRLAHFRHDTTTHLRVGDMVEQADYLGQIGQTGISTAPHLHMQVMRSKRGASVDFDFVEAKPLQGSWVTSRLLSGLSMIDDDGRLNAGSLLSNTSTSRRYTWRQYNAHYPSVGESYYTSDTMYARHYWYFAMSEGGRYDLYASCKALSNRTYRAQYRFRGPGSNDYSYIDQRDYPANQPAGLEDLHYVDTVFPTGYGDYYIRARKVATGRLCADAVFIRKRD